MSSKFKYSYSAPTESERKEIEYIQSQYLKPTEESTKLERLRSLDGKVKNIPTCSALAFGIIGLLIFGLGMAMVLEWELYVFGVVIGVIGAFGVGFAHFVYKSIFNKLKNKYSEEILNLSNELLKEEPSKDKK